MSKNRVEAFSDGVIAIILTIMVLELKVPHHAGIDDLKALLPAFLSYVLSFVYIGIYWNNHHHLFQAASCVNGTILWANLHLLFWLSLVPFVTGWMGENGFSTMPIALYGVVLLCAGFAYYLLSQALVLQHGKDSDLAKAIGKDSKGLLSLVLYALAIIVAFYCSWVSLLLYTGVAFMWLIPDTRIEKTLEVDTCGPSEEK